VKRKIVYKGQSLLRAHFTGCEPVCPVIILIPPVNEKTLKPIGTILDRICVHHSKREEKIKQANPYSMTKLS